MKKSLILFLMPLLLLTACQDLIVKGSGDLITETRDEDDFSGLSISVPGKVEVRTGTTYSIEIEVEESLVSYLETKVRNGRLDIYFSKPVRDVDDLLIKITMPNLDQLDVSGSAEVVVFDAIDGDELELDVSGSGEIDLKAVDFNKINADISGSGEIRIAGVADDLELDLSGSGELNSLDCPVKTADLDVAGSGTVRCHVKDELKARISGSGDVYYEGTPSLDVQITGSGKVKKL